MNVIDVIAPDDAPEPGRRHGDPAKMLLEETGAKVDEVEMSFLKRILDTLIDPN